MASRRASRKPATASRKNDLKSKAAIGPRKSRNGAQSGWKSKNRRTRSFFPLSCSFVPTRGSLPPGRPLRTPLPPLHFLLQLPELPRRHAGRLLAAIFSLSHFLPFRSLRLPTLFGSPFSGLVHPRDWIPTRSARNLLQRRPFWGRCRSGRIRRRRPRR